ERERLRELYRNASDTEAILAIERRLSEVQGKIERLKAQRKELRRRVALSTIRVELREPEPEPEPDPSGQQWYDTPVVAAFLNSANGVVVTMPVWWASVNLLVGVSAPAVGFFFVSRRAIDLRQFGRFLVSVAGLSLIPYGVFVLNSPLASLVKSSVAIRLVAFAVICTTAYALTYRRTLRPRSA
ncbi:MAG: DUF4349 domain-containing protein, partial [Halobaculum sp.]